VPLKYPPLLTVPKPNGLDSIENVTEESLLALREMPNDDPVANEPNKDAVEIVGTFDTIIVNARSVVWSS